MKEMYSIGYVDTYNISKKVGNDLGYTKKFATIEEAEEYVNQKLIMNKNYINTDKPIKIMQGWIVIKEIKLK